MLCVQEIVTEGSLFRVLGGTFSSRLANVLYKLFSVLPLVDFIAGSVVVCNCNGT